MFSSDNNSYPLFYQQSPSLSNDAIPESNNILFQHYNGKLLPPLFPATSDNSLVKLSSEPLINQQSNILCPSNVVIDNVSSSRRPPCKKDRHTKISTAQGVRDRRVRLSMNIAREFFNLQDMLGFDKASKTLGWLLNKSKAAIDELATARSLKMKTPSEDTHVKDQDDDHGDEEKKALGGKSSSKKRKKRENNLNSRNVAKEMRRREEARQRARERTRKKKIVDDHHNNQQQLESLNHHQPLYHHQRVLQDLVFCQSNSATTPNNNSPPNELISKAGSTVRETVVIKSNSKSRGSSYNYNYETMITSKDAKESCNFNYGDFCNNKSASESCNYGGMIIQPPGLSALNIINLSTEIHIDARPWDAYDNQLLH